MGYSMSENTQMLEQRGFEYGVVHMLAPYSGNLLNILADSLHIELDLAQKLIQLGAIYVTGKRCLENISVTEKTYIRAHTKPRRFPANDHQWKSRVLFECNDFAVINKPAALPCHASVDNIQENMLAYLKADLGQEFFMTHRLDVPTSGIIVIAKNKKFQSEFNTLLQDHLTEKVYTAICTKQQPPLGLIKHYMEISPRAPKKVFSEEKENTQECLLEILESKPIEAQNFFVRIKLLTGRTHQIRAQLSELGSPIQGDYQYGANKIYDTEKIDLTASELRFTNPLDQKRYEFKLENVGVSL